ncbi:MAG: Asp-tRNA(Asn)/Glu-tRNA(Gln) amidotransferase subunit GatA [Patescibacteria group bacterium]
MAKRLNELTIAEARKMLDADEITSVDLTQSCLDEIRSLNGSLNAVLETFEEDAMASARQSDARRDDDGSRNGVLDGIPLIVKDNILVQGKHASAGSKILATHVAASDATVTRKLKEQGAVILGRSNMDEFAMGSSTERSAYGPTRNPHDPERVPGGSSGGSAVAVAANFCLGALGSDTGGSIRQPASFCGIVGLKPTYGRVSRSGLMAMASSFDQIGPLTKTTEDAALLLQAIQGQDPLDQTTSDHAPFATDWREKLGGLRVGIPRQAWGEGMSDGVRESVLAAVEQLKSLGANVVEVDLPYVDEALAVYYLLMPCEVSANLARFDGMRFGVRKENLPLFETYMQSRAEGLGPEVRRRILLGTFALSRGYYDAYYLKAKKVQTLIRRAYESAFREVDVLLTPTAPTTAFKIGEKTSDPLAMYLEDIFTVGVNVAGLPAISVPCGKSEGLPVGMHLTGKAFDEATVLAVARAYEEAQT